MPPPTPSIRAALCQQSLAVVREHMTLGPELVDVVTRIEGASRTGWLPLADEIALHEAFVATHGIEGFRARWKGAMLGKLRGPVFGPIVQVSVGMYGLSPEGLLAFFPQGFQAVFKDSGRLELVDVKEGSGTVMLRQPAPEALRSEAFINAVAAVIDAGTEITAHVGRTDVSVVDGDVRFHLEWSQPG